MLYNSGMEHGDICGNCGAVFARAKSSQRFCTRTCQRDAVARHDKAARALYRAAVGIIGTEAPPAATISAMKDEIDVR